MSESDPSMFDEVAWERFLRIGALIAFVTATFVFTASEVLPGELSTIAVGAIGPAATLQAINGVASAAAGA